MKIVKNITEEIIDFFYLEIHKKKNKRKLKYILDISTNLLFSNFKPYFYTILAILILMFSMNIMNFYYYIRLFVKSNPKINLDVD